MGLLHDNLDSTVTCFMVVFWFQNLQFRNRLSILVLWGLNMKNLDCVYVVFPSWKIGRKSSLHVDFLVRITCSFFVRMMLVYACCFSELEN